MNRFVTGLFCSLFAVNLSGQEAAEPRQFRVWAASCAHVPADIRHGRESLAKVIRQSEGSEPGAPGFDWDVMIDAGDLSAHQTPPGDKDGMELIRQYQISLTKHRREQIYNVPGNHDAPYYDHGPGSWIRKWGDPLGENTKFSGVDPNRRPFPVEGNWERYRFQAGNILFLMLADRNDAPEPVGRGHSMDGKSGGYPAGAVTRDTFEWWKQQVLENQDKLIVTMHHHVLRDTTTASGFGEGEAYHGSSGGVEGSSYLYYLIEKDDPDDFQFTANAHVFEDFLDDFHRKNGRGAIDFWIGGHTHVKGPEDDFGGKTISETKWGVGFLQAAALTVHHGGSHPLSRLLTFTGGSDAVKVQTYLHEAKFRDQPVGFYEPAERIFQLRHRFESPDPIEAMSPFPESATVFEKPYAGAVEGKGEIRRNTSRVGLKAGASPDLTGLWKPEAGGSFHLETQLKEDTGDKIDRKPALVMADGFPEFGTVEAMKFDGSQRLHVGQVDMEDWTDLTVSAWIRTEKNTPGMRIVSKDRLGEPGCFMLRQSAPGVWVMQAWDDRAKRWAAATWRTNGNTINDGRWHHLSGVVDSEKKKVLLIVDGETKSEAAWTAETLDDSDGADLVVGADSGEKQIGDAFQGLIHDVRIIRRHHSQ